MRFKYIGLKVDGERAFREWTGIEWMPGAVHDVTHAGAASEMLRHPTVWQPVDAPSVEPATDKIPRLGPVDDAEVDDQIDRERDAASKEPEADPLAGLDDAAVREWAKARGLKVHSIALLKGSNLRERVRAAAKA